MILFEYNNVFAYFTEAFQEKLGEPSMMTQDEYDAALASIVKTDFYDVMKPKMSGIEVLKWARTYGDKKVYLLLRNEKKSPSWVNQRKLLFIDALCAANNIPRFEFDACKTDADFLGHSARGVLVCGNGNSQALWDGAGYYLSTWHNDDAALTIQAIKNATQTFNVANGLEPPEI